MSLSTKSAKPIVLHTEDFELTYQFSAPPCTSDIANDGVIPFGTTVSGVAITTTDYETGDTVTDLVVSSSVSSNVVSITMSYTSAASRIKLVCIMTLDNSSKIEWATTNIYCESN